MRELEPKAVLRMWDSSSGFAGFVLTLSVIVKRAGVTCAVGENVC